MYNTFPPNSILPETYQNFELLHMFIDKEWTSFGGILFVCSVNLLSTKALDNDISIEYRMKLSPLREEVKDSIEPQDMIPLVLLRENPESGIPAVCVEDLTSCGHVLYRIFFFSLGLAISVTWTFLACILPINYLGYDLTLLIGTIMLVGVLPIAIFFFWEGFRDCLVSLNLTCFDLKLIDNVEVKKIRSNRGIRTNAN